MDYIPINWIRNYEKYICQFSKEYGTEITDAVKEELENMINEWEVEQRITGDEYVLCIRKNEVVERKPNGFVMTREVYIPVGE